MKLDLPDAMVDAMCNMLANHAYKDVAAILNTIQMQANDPRVQAMQIPAPSVVPQEE
jgi:hypothetical protein